MTEIALIGNQNCGKTTLFNRLTGSRQKVGNWAGVTVEKRTGNYKKDKTVNVIDLPGLYSLNTDTLDEKVVINYLKNTPPNAIINLVDGTNLYRSLRLTLELLSLNLPVVVAINMADELEKRGININEEELSKRLGVSVIKISATKNQNVEKLVEKAKEISKTKVDIKNLDAKNVSLEHVNQIVLACTKEKSIKSKTEAIDKLLINRYLGIPIFFAVMLLTYFCAIRLGGLLGGLISGWFESLSARTEISLKAISTPDLIISLVCDAIFGGVGSVIAFLPQILILFLFITILEESGYMARVVFLFDRLFSYFGLSGKSFVPLILSCGCAVTGVMATKTIESEVNRKNTIYLAPFMPCGAKLAVYAWLSQILFGGSALVATCLYFISIFSVFIGALFLKKVRKSKAGGGFILDMPIYRAPSIKNVFIVLIEKIKDFLFKAGTIIFLVSVVLWGLTNFGFSGYTAGDVEKSFLRVLGGSFGYILYPIGLNNWQISVSILSSFFAKEAVIETFSYLSANAIALLNPFTAYSFLVFITTSPPCFATLVTAKKELGGKCELFKMIGFQFLFSYLLCSLINFLGIIYYNNLLTSFIILVIIIMLVIISIRILRRRKCINCSACKKCGENKRERKI